MADAVKPWLRSLIETDVRGMIDWKSPVKLEPGIKPEPQEDRFDDDGTSLLSRISSPRLDSGSRVQLLKVYSIEKRVTCLVSDGEVQIRAKLSVGAARILEEEFEDGLSLTLRHDILLLKEFTLYVVGSGFAPADELVRLDIEGLEYVMTTRKTIGQPAPVERLEKIQPMLAELGLIQGKAHATGEDYVVHERATAAANNKRVEPRSSQPPASQALASSPPELPQQEPVTEPAPEPERDVILLDSQTSHKETQTQARLQTQPTRRRTPRDSTFDREGFALENGVNLSLPQAPGLWQAGRPQAQATSKKLLNLFNKGGQGSNVNGQTIPAQGPSKPANVPAAPSPKVASSPKAAQTSKAAPVIPADGAVVAETPLRAKQNRQDARSPAIPFPAASSRAAPSPAVSARAAPSPAVSTTSKTQTPRKLQQRQEKSVATGPVTVGQPNSVYDPVKAMAFSLKRQRDAEETEARELEKRRLADQAQATEHPGPGQAIEGLGDFGRDYAAPSLRVHGVVVSSDNESDDEDHDAGDDLFTRKNKKIKRSHVVDNATHRLAPQELEMQDEIQSAQRMPDSSAIIRPPLLEPQEAASGSSRQSNPRESASRQSNRHKIPEEQKHLLDDKSSWSPSLPGQTLPHPNIPIRLLRVWNVAQAPPVPSPPAAGVPRGPKNGIHKAPTPVAEAVAAPDADAESDSSELLSSQQWPPTQPRSPPRRRQQMPPDSSAPMNGDALPARQWPPLPRRGQLPPDSSAEQGSSPEKALSKRGLPATTPTGPRGMPVRPSSQRSNIPSSHSNGQDERNDDPLRSSGELPMTVPRALVSQTPASKIPDRRDPARQTSKRRPIPASQLPDRRDPARQTTERRPMPVSQFPDRRDPDRQFSGPKQTPASQIPDRRDPATQPRRPMPVSQVHDRRDADRQFSGTKQIPASQIPDRRDPATARQSSESRLPWVPPSQRANRDPPRSQYNDRSVAPGTTGRARDGMPENPASRPAANGGSNSGGSQTPGSSHVAQWARPERHVEHDSRLSISGPPMRDPPSGRPTAESLRPERRESVVQSSERPAPELPPPRPREQVQNDQQASVSRPSTQDPGWLHPDRRDQVLQDPGPPPSAVSTQNRFPPTYPPYDRRQQGYQRSPPHNEQARNPYPLDNSQGPHDRPPDRSQQSGGRPPNRGQEPYGRSPERRPSDRRQKATEWTPALSQNAYSQYATDRTEPFPDRPFGRGPAHDSSAFDPSDRTQQAPDRPSDRTQARNSSDFSLSDRTQQAPDRPFGRAEARDVSASSRSERYFDRKEGRERQSDRPLPSQGEDNSYGPPRGYMEHRARRGVYFRGHQQRDWLEKNYGSDSGPRFSLSTALRDYQAAYPKDPVTAPEFLQAFKDAFPHAQVNTTPESTPVRTLANGSSGPAPPASSTLESPKSAGQKEIAEKISLSAETDRVGSALPILSPPKGSAPVTRDKTGEASKDAAELDRRGPAPSILSSFRASWDARHLGPESTEAVGMDEAASTWLRAAPGGFWARSAGREGDRRRNRKPMDVLSWDVW